MPEALRLALPFSLVLPSLLLGGKLWRVWDLGSGAKALASSVEACQSNVKLQINVISLSDKDVTDNYQIHFIASGSIYPPPLIYLCI